MATQSIIGSLPMTSGNHQAGLGRAEQSKVYLDPESLRKPEYTVYLHTISRRSHLQPHPIYRNVAVPKCPADKRSHCFMRIQHPVQIPHLNPDDVNGPPMLKIEHAKRVALSICNPGFIGTDLTVQDKELDAESVIASGECNLTRQGIFASMNEVPTEDELRKAEARREAYFKFRYQEAEGLARSNPAKLDEILQQDHHLAAEYFGRETKWHSDPTSRIDCPNCGNKISDKAAFHYDNGRICILDWERAWLSGAIKKEDVPEPKRWWSDEDSEPMKRGPGRPPKVQGDI